MFILKIIENSNMNFVLAACLKAMSAKYILVNSLTEHRLQLRSKLVIDEQVDEEVGQVVDVECETKVAADWSNRGCKVVREYDWSVGQDEDDEQTETDLHCFHVAGPGARVNSEIIKKMLSLHLLAPRTYLVFCGSFAQLENCDVIIEFFQIKMGKYS